VNAPARRTARGAGPPRPRRARSTTSRVNYQRRPRWRRRAIVVALLGAGLAIGLSRIDVEKAIREITLPLQHEDIIRQQAREKDLDPALVAAVIYAESRFREQESKAGAIGLMQITPKTAHYIERLSGGQTFVTSDLNDPQINISYGCYYLRHLLDRYGQNQVAALAAYNAGTTNVDAWGGADLTLDTIRFQETRAYVEEVMSKRDDYASKYSRELGLP
jgi:soluble lytic murein transglycosylase